MSLKPKNKKVCEGCKYLMKSDGLVSLNNTCNYMSITGKSRLQMEEKNGGYKSDSCCCYEKGRRVRVSRKKWNGSAKL